MNDSGLSQNTFCFSPRRQDAKKIQKNLCAFAPLREIIGCCVSPMTIELLRMTTVGLMTAVLNYSLRNHHYRAIRFN